MTASQRTKYTKRRAQIWDALHPAPPVTAPEKTGDDKQVESVVPPVAKHGHAQAKGFAASTAQATGMTKQAINRHLARADALGDTTLDKITGTSLDTGVEMDALAKLPETTRWKKESTRRSLAWT